ncbi:hypothetical protein TNCV_2738731 [Trichonephila clavipes]|nr:hypothetical protein TNCV_2738731 [Trichonephila clavipes]
MVTRGPKVLLRLWNQFETSGTVTRNVSQDRDRASTTAQDRYFALSAQRHRWTMVPQLALDLAPVSGRRIPSLHPSCIDWPLRPVSVLCVPLTTSSWKNRKLWS